MGAALDHSAPMDGGAACAPSPHPSAWPLALQLSDGAVRALEDGRPAGPSQRVSRPAGPVDTGVGVLTAWAGRQGYTGAPLRCVAWADRA
ncbi:hypothetical protein NDU88_002877 [Pleurodeles waltl]|uniref:Uncharacterized protein n=1 Tax=Pleurodeles waltl TaxID=8319 RepID=A0AAV7MCB4_PLEWA|nr:hypothetical protein NDU88_002877 [Pleurodeles waltl]